jgi:hypothetical protein
MVIRSGGLTFGIRTNRPELLDRVLERVPKGWTRSTRSRVIHMFSLRFAGAADRPGTRHFHLVYYGAGRQARTLDLEEALDAFEGSLHHAIASWGKQRLFVHAGVVGWRGKAIVLPGRSHAGKTSLVQALVRAGATYYSDEYAPIDEHGRVHPFARALRVRTEEGTVRRPVEELGGKAGRSPLPVGMVALTEYKPGASWRPRRLTEGETCLGLLENTVPARHRAAEALSRFRDITGGAVAIRTARGEADAAAAALLARCRW